MGGLEPAVIVTRGEKENNPVYGKGASAATDQQPSWGDRGPLLGKQEERISRTHRATRRPPAPASADSPQLLLATSWACLSIPLSLCSSDHETQASSFGGKAALSVQSHSGGAGESPGGCSLLPPDHTGPTPETGPLGPQLQAEWGAQQAWPPWGHSPVWKPTKRAASHCERAGAGITGVDRGLCQVTATRAAPECGLGLKTPGAQRRAWSGTGREG